MINVEEALHCLQSRWREVGILLHLRNCDVKSMYTQHMEPAWAMGKIIFLFWTFAIIVWQSLDLPHGKQLWRLWKSLPGELTSLTFYKGAIMIVLV